MEENDGLTDLRIDTTLDGPAIDGYICLFVLQLVAFGNPDHLLHQVQASNALCDWMLHLGSQENIQLTGSLLEPDLLGSNRVLACSRVFISRK